MTLTKLLQTGRKKAGLTQEDAAAALEVSPRTIHNWEDGCVRPDPSLWNSILAVYGVAHEEFRDAYFDAACPPGEPRLSDGFPSMMFSDYVLDGVRKLVFSPMETEMLKMLAIYYPDWLHFSDAVDVFRELPYNYACRFDITDFRSAIESLRDRFGFNTDILKSTNDWITGAPRLRLEGLGHGAVEVFDINKLPLLYVREMAGSIKDWNSLTHQAFLMMRLIKSGRTTVFEKEERIYDLLQKERPWSLDLNSYFNDDWGDLIRIHEIITDEMTSDKSSEIYGVRVAIPSLFAERALLDDTEASAPAYDWIKFDYVKTESGSIVSCNASLTEKGEALWAYAESNTEIFGL